MSRLFFLERTKIHKATLASSVSQALKQVTYYVVIICYERNIFMYVR